MSSDLVVKRFVEAPLVYRGERVITLRQMDEAHQRPDGTAKRNFHENRGRLQEGRHFFEVTQRDEIRTLGIERPQGGTPESVTLLTEFGYLLLVKSFRDELAWQVQEVLVATYFRAKETPRPPAQLTAESLSVCLAACERVLSLGGLEDRDRIALKDFARDGLLIVSGHLQPVESVAVVISNRARELGFSRLDRGAEIEIGKRIAARYRAAHGKEPQRRSQHVDGAVRSVNHYTFEDIGLVDAGIRDYFKDSN